MKKIFLIIFYSTFSFGQKTEPKDFSIIQIDSIANKDGKYGNSDGAIEIKNQDGKVIGNGGSSITTYLFLPYKSEFDKLPKKKKKKFNVYKDAKLIKGNFHKVIHYENYTENIFIQNYYNGKGLFYVKIKLSRKEENKEEEILEYNLDLPELHNYKEIKNEFLLNIKEIINNINMEILNFHEI